MTCDAIAHMRYEMEMEENLERMRIKFVQDLNNSNMVVVSETQVSDRTGTLYVNGFSKIGRVRFVLQVDGKAFAMVDEGTFENAVRFLGWLTNALARQDGYDITRFEQPEQHRHDEQAVHQYMHN